MMGVLFHAKLEWIGKENSDFIFPPEGAKVYPLIHITENEIWSIVFVCPDFNKTDEVEFTMLADTAPTELIEEKHKYGLYVGAMMVAEAYIIEKQQ